MKRCIMIFLDFDNIDIIEEVRKKYDPTFKLVAPHITLVFPFESELTKLQIEGHIDNVLRDVKKFKVELQGITSKKSFENYIFLEVKKGTKELKKLHKALYTGILKKYLPSWIDKVDFTPHMTVGKLQTNEEMLGAIEDLKDVKNKFKAIVTQVSVELMYDDASSSIELVKKLA